MPNRLVCPTSPWSICFSYARLLVKKHISNAIKTSCDRPAIANRKFHPSPDLTHQVPLLDRGLPSVLQVPGRMGLMRGL